MSERLAKLMQMRQRDPADAFLPYAIALEHKKAGAYPEAVQWLDVTLKQDPTYAVALFQMGQVHELAGNAPAARQAYIQGIEVATKNGDHHAADEMRGALEMIS